MRLGMVLAVLLVLMALPPGKADAASGDDQLAVAADHYAQQRWELAVGEFASLLKDYPDHERRSEAVYYSGEALLQLARYQEAAVRYGEFLESFPTHKLAEQAHFRQGEAAYLAEQFAEAREHFKSFLGNHPQSAQVPLAKVYLAGAILALNEANAADDTENLERAAELFREALAVGPPGSLADTCRFGLTRCEQLLHQTENATAGYRQLQQSEQPQLAAQSHYYLGQIEADADDHAAAAKTWESLIKKWPRSAWARAALGQTAVQHAAAGDFDAARAAVKRWQADPQAPLEGSLIRRTAQLARQAKETEWALALYGLLAAEADQPAAGIDSLARIADTQIESGRLAGATETLRKLVDKTDDPAGKAAASLRLAEIEQRLNRPEQALKTCLSIKKQWPDSAAALPAMQLAAQLLSALGQPQRAAALYAELATAGQSDKDAAQTLYRWAWTLSDQDQKEQAATKFTRLRTEYPDSRYWADATYRLAESELENGHTERARELLAELLARDTNRSLSGHALYLDAKAAAKMGQWQAMQKSLATLVHQFPESTLIQPARYLLAEAAYQAGDYETAEATLLSLGDETMPESRAAKVRLRRAQIRAQSEDWAEARKLAEPLVTAGGANLPEDELFYLLGRCQIAAANFEQARTSFRRAAQRDQRARTETAAMAQWMIGESLMHQENYQAAVAEYYRVVSLYPHPRWQAAALLQAAKCYEHLDRNQEAARLYRQIQEDYPETEFVEQAQERVERLPARSQAPQT